MLDGPTERQVKTDRTGIVTLNALPLGTYGLRVTRSGYQPTVATVRLGRGAPQFVSLRLDDVSFSELRRPASVVETGKTADPIAAHAFTQIPASEVVSGTVGIAAGVSLEGTSPDESLVELDGIPIAGGSSGPAALRFRNALALDRIAVAEGPVLEGTSVRDAIGGIVNYRTPGITVAPDVEAVVGHDSDFGSFQHVLFSQTFGALGVLADAVTGGGTNRSQTAKLQFALAPAVSLGFAAYGSQSSANYAQTTVQNVAPAYATDLRAKFGVATLEARAFDSISDTSVFTPGGAAFGENARIHGLQLGLDLPLGSDILTAGLDRRSDGATFGNGASYDRTFTTLTLRTDLALGSAGRLELGAALSGGTQLQSRVDPEAQLTLHPAPTVTVRLAAGSGFATAPDVVLATAAASPAVADPETSFGYRASAETPLRGRDRIWAAAYELRRFDRFASLADARSLGVQAGFDAPPPPGGLGAVAFVELAKTYAYGARQPFPRYAGLEPLVPLAQLPGDPYSKARLALSYHSTAGFVLQAGTTLLGAGNELADHAVALGDASLRVTFGKIGAVTLGLSNAFGTVVPNPFLAPLYEPRELTLTLGH